MTDNPWVQTSKGWSPIEHFDFEAEYADNPFLVYLPDGRWNEAWVERAGFDNAPGFVGEWRYVEIPGEPSVTTRIQTMEPIAFMVITAPDLGELAEIVSQKAA